MLITDITPQFHGRISREDWAERITTVAEISAQSPHNLRTIVATRERALNNFIGGVANHIIKVN